MSEPEAVTQKRAMQVFLLRYVNERGPVGADEVRIVVREAFPQAPRGWADKELRRCANLPVGAPDRIDRIAFGLYDTHIPPRRFLHSRNG